MESETLIPIKEPELPYSVLYNCWEYVRYIYPQTPPTAQILANLEDTGEIGVLTYYGWLKHYVVVEKVEGDLVYFSESNFDKGKITYRSLPISDFDGFYSLE